MSESVAKKIAIHGQKIGGFLPHSHSK